MDTVQLVVDTSRPVKMKYSKKLEMFPLYLSYGPHFTAVENLTYYSLIMTHCSKRVQSWDFSACGGQFLSLYKVCKENMIPSIFSLFISNLLDNVP